MNQEPDNEQSDGRSRARLRLALIAGEDTFLYYKPYLNRLLLGLGDESVSVVLVCPPEVNVESIMFGNPEVIRYPVLPFSFLAHYDLKILTEQLLKFKPYVLHCLSDKLAALARHLSKRLNVPYVLTINSLQKRMSYVSVSSKRLASIIVPCESIAQNVSEHYPGFSERIRLIKIGTFVTNSALCFSRPERVASIITSSGFQERADLTMLFAALKHLAVEDYEFVIAVITGDDSEGQLRKMISSLGLSQIVIIVPKLAPWRELLTAADIFVNPSVDSHFNISVLEAMSIGAGVVGCKGGVDDLIIKGETAFVFEQTDEFGIYNCLKEVLNSREKTKKIAQQAQKFISRNFTVSGMVEETLKCYDDAVSWYKKD